jgi:dihydrofolate synthase/folylpolyglutamate synthase
MSYAAAVDQLNAMVPELYQSSGQPRRKFSLGEIRILLSALGDPHRRFPAVLIAGTNGKGSTAATLASILTASGLRTGLYTSPHLARVNERIRLDRVEIDDEVFARLYFHVHDAAQQLVLDERLPQLPSFFEILTAQALLYFAEAHVDIAVLEVGMGGRLDATNIVDPLLSVITDISLDHTEWLGSTIAAITREKAGILRRNGVLVTLPQHPEANQVLGEVANELSVRGVSAVPYMPPTANATGSYAVEALGAFVTVDSPLAGAHQHRNLALAIAAAVELATNQGFPIARPPGAHRERRRYLDSRRRAQPCRSLGPACRLERTPRRRGQAAHPHLQLPARQAGRGDGADSISALRSGDPRAYARRSRRGHRRPACGGPRHGDPGNGGGISELRVANC